MQDEHPTDENNVSEQAFYLPLDGPDGERFLATAATEGPWSADAQHAGPPSALLVRAVERCAPRPDLQPVRFTFELFGPVPLGELTVHAEVERTGRAVELVAAELAADGRTIVRARAWRVARSDTVAVAGPPAAPLPGPDGVEPQGPLPEHWTCGYIENVEWRWVKGAWLEPGDGAVWGRPRLPLVAGEEMSPVQRVAVVADSGNGISGRLDLREWLYMNTELTIHLHRPPTGEWVGVDARTIIGPTGAGLATTTLHDPSGPVGQGAQALLVRPR
ncbi:Thioesterase-like superfamily protein [Pseudonocardia thermophila]|uniref:Thioesterase-like superfamily protein n=1 Tax=Pseudonocardia thermophila TaxID=1848 RepID=A0A1M6NDG8_PSETH|nr:thioesterase family protein [Pseudonocardia thermophila]SHJ93798.1 Thioesterase-like superfamily protein [Pseudonocardia thermophila]